MKGKAAPDLVRHPERLLHPVRRPNPKGAADPGRQRITWDEALDETASRLGALARDHGPESVVFGSASPSTSAMSDSIDWLSRLRRAFGSPNICMSMELCGWGRALAPIYTYGEAVPGAYMPDLDRAGCILFWAYNPSIARLAHATSTAAALRRGARLVVVDPRRAGLAEGRPLVARPSRDRRGVGALVDPRRDRARLVRRRVRAPLDQRAAARAHRRRPPPADRRDRRQGRRRRVRRLGGDARGATVTNDPTGGRYAVDEDRLALSAPGYLTRYLADRLAGVLEQLNEHEGGALLFGDLIQLAGSAWASWPPRRCSLATGEDQLVELDRVRRFLRGPVGLEARVLAGGPAREPRPLGGPAASTRTSRARRPSSSRSSRAAWSPSAVSNSPADSMASSSTLTVVRWYSKSITS